MNIRPWFVACVLASALAGNFANAAPQNYLFTDSDELSRLAPLLKRPDIGGAQIVYTWKSLEPARDQYDFTQIEKDLRYLEGLNRKLFIQLQDRFFEIEHRGVPLYLQTDPVYGGGLVPQADNPGENKPVGHGWATQQWNPAVRDRYQRLLTALAQKFDGRVYGINLPESAIDIDIRNDKSGFTCEKYFAAELENVAFARKAFVKSHVVQYVNFWPCEWNNDKKFMSRAFEFAQANGIGLGGPDIVPYKKGQMKNAYPFFHQYKVEPGSDGSAGTDTHIHQPRNEKAVHARRVRGVRGRLPGSGHHFLGDGVAVAQTRNLAHSAQITAGLRCISGRRSCRCS